MFDNILGTFDKKISRKTPIYEYIYKSEHRPHEKSRFGKIWTSGIRKFAQELAFVSLIWMCICMFVFLCSFKALLDVFDLGWELNHNFFLGFWILTCFFCLTSNTRSLAYLDICFLTWPKIRSHRRLSGYLARSSPRVVVLSSCEKSCVGHLGNNREEDYESVLEMFFKFIPWILIISFQRLCIWIKSWKRLLYISLSSSGGDSVDHESYQDDIAICWIKLWKVILRS